MLAVNVSSHAMYIGALTASFRGIGKVLWILRHEIQK
jgi:hypothetical protein